MAHAIMTEGTPSQQAAAAMHLENREDWRYVHVSGVRYVVLASARSSRTYWVRDDAAGCSCPWYIKTGTTCSHMLAVRRDSAQDAAPKPRASYADLFPKCRTCDDLADARDGFCDRCASDREWQARREAVAS